jgi:hypothetical protein
VRVWFRGALKTSFPSLFTRLHGKKLLRFPRVARQCKTETLAPDIGAMTEDVPTFGLVPAVGELSTRAGRCDLGLVEIQRLA